MNKHMQMLQTRAINSFCAGIAILLATLNPAAINLAIGQETAEIPRMADGHPDLTGVWWTGGDLGSPGFNTSRAGQERVPTYTDLYQPWAVEHANTLGDKNDPTLQCKSTAFGTLNVRLFDVGTVGQIISTPAMVTFLQETFHGYQLIPTDGRPHRSVPPSFRGDSVGHWEGDAFVVETKSFTDDTWLFAEGLVSFHSDQMRVVERYQRIDANTLVIDATVYDEGVLTAPWVVPPQKLVLAPFDRLLPLICTGVETQELMDAAAEIGE